MSGILLADVGGTNIRFALATADGVLDDARVRTFEVAAFPGPEEAARVYLAASGARPRAAVFAVAAHVDGDVLDLTNHPWRLSRAALCAALGLADLVFVNDFEAQAHAIPQLDAAHLVAIGHGDAQAAARVLAGADDRCWAVLGAGTGLGVSGLVRRRGDVFALPGEGGHVGFAPEGPDEVALRDALAAEFGRVSVERIVSGGGLLNVYRALARADGDDTPALAPRDVAGRADAGEARARRALEIFCDVFGAVAGDVVLTLGAWDGVFLTGGLVPRRLADLQRGGFRRRFEHKGRFSTTLAAVPVFAVLHPQPGLLGAAAIAARRFGAAAGVGPNEGRR